MTVEDKLTGIKGIGPGRAELLARLGLFSVRDILCYAPREHLDLREAKPISLLEHGEYAVVRVSEIEKPKVSYPVINGKRTPVVNVTLGDGTGRLRCAWYNQLYVRSQIPETADGFVYGRIDKTRGCVMINAVFCKAAPGLLPVYTLTKGLGQGTFRSCIRRALNSLEGRYGDILPDEIRMRHGLCTIGAAYENLHFPVETISLNEAKRRMSFDEALGFSLLLETLRSRAGSAKGISFNTLGALERFLALLPFEPTGGQLEVMRAIENDMASPAPMNRLIQGDVGSGKTVLAIYAMFIAAENGYQSAFMAPTELLALQHYEVLKKYFGSKVIALTGSMKKAERTAALTAIENGEAMVVIGTHALIEEGVAFSRLGVVITDEQHRFGVRQRALLGGKAERCDSLIMSATPIPRTLSLIMYGDLDVSQLKELPAGRRQIITRYVPPYKRQDMYRYIEREINERGIQAFVVCPMIEENEDIAFACSAESVYAELKENLSVRTALIHGRMKPAARDEIMQSFRAGEIDLIVSTTVIEVGVDVPNACIMAIESTERFGLAQLHQLRGRVGRSDKQSYCFLLSESSAASAAERIKVLVNSSNGFEIAEQDLLTRGPGELLGHRQSGLAGITSAFLLADMNTLEAARNEAKALLGSKSLEEKKLVESVLSRYGNVLEDIAIN